MAIFHVRAVKVQLDLSGIPDHLVHLSGFGGKDTGVQELDLMGQADAVFGNSLFIWMLQMYVLVVLLHPGLRGMDSLPVLGSTTFSRHILHAWSLEFQVILHRQKGTGCSLVADPQT